MGKRWVAVVGSREFRSPDLVTAFVLGLDPRTDAVVSGGARGVDSTAAQAARLARFELEEKLPRYAAGAPYGAVVAALFARNTEIVDRADVVHAFINVATSADRAGKTKGRSNGTFDTISKAARAGRPIIVHYDDGTTRELTFPVAPTRRRLESLIYPWEHELPSGSEEA